MASEEELCFQSLWVDSFELFWFEILPYVCIEGFVAARAPNWTTKLIFLYGTEKFLQRRVTDVTMTHKLLKASILHLNR
jgi:hypothetical protein